MKLIFLFLFTTSLFSIDNSWKPSTFNEIFIDQSLEKNKVIFYYFHSKKCPYCKKLENNYLNLNKFKKEFYKYNKLSLYPNKDKYSKKIFKQIKGIGYPTFIISLPIYNNYDNFLIIRNRINPNDDKFSIDEYNSNINDLIYKLYLNKIYSLYKNEKKYIETSIKAFVVTNHPDFLYYQFVYLSKEHKYKESIEIMNKILNEFPYYRNNEIIKEKKKLQRKLKGIIQ